MIRMPGRVAQSVMSGYRCVSDCRSRGREFDPCPVPYFRGDWSWNYFYGHSPPFRWFIQEGLLSVTSESMCTKYWLTACSSLPRKSVVRWTDRPAMTIAVDLGRKATKQTNKQTNKQTMIRIKEEAGVMQHNCVNTCHAEYFHALLSFPIFIQLICQNSVISMYSQAEWKTVWILISWFLRSHLIWIFTVFQNGIYGISWFSMKKG